MAQSIAYMMNGRKCPYLETKPELLFDAYVALTTYYRDCENARITLNLRLDDIFREFDKMESLEKPSEPAY
jgi:hypothetical protein